MRERLEKELQRLKDEGIVTPVQFSEWAAHIFPVVKRIGNICVCGDYKLTVNQASKIETYPLPQIEDVFAALSGGQAFSILHLSHAYLQVEVEDDCEKFLTINTHKGLFEFSCLPFGVASVPAMFQRIMDSLLQRLPGMASYIDNVIVTGRTDDEHLANLGRALTSL